MNEKLGFIELEKQLTNKGFLNKWKNFMNISCPFYCYMRDLIKSYEKENNINNKELINFFENNFLPYFIVKEHFNMINLTNKIN